MNINDSLYNVVRNSCLNHPHDMALFYQGKKISNSDFIQYVDEAADILTYSLGVNKGDTVLLAQPNIPQVVILIYALNKIGAVINLVHPYVPFDKLNEIISETNSKYAFVFERIVAHDLFKYRTMKDKIVITRAEDFLPVASRVLYHLFVNGSIRKKLAKRPGFSGFTFYHKLFPIDQETPNVVLGDNETAVLLHSGSTTGVPKTICLANRNLNFIAERYSDIICATPDEMRNKGMLSVLPSFHGFGFCMTMHCPLVNGSASILIPKFSPLAVKKALDKVDILKLCGTPGMYETLLHSDVFFNSKNLSSIFVGFAGGDMLPVAVKEAFDDAMKKHGVDMQIFEGYGLTEAVAANIVNTYKNNKKGSIGKPIRDVEVAIFDDEGNKLPHGEIGEIAIKSGAVMLGYYHDEVASKACIRDGWLFTGDFGYIDDEGFVFFKSRKKRVIKVSGVGVFPSEIENVVMTIPEVKEAVAISIPDKKMKNAIKVVVSIKEENPKIKEMIMNACKKYLIRWAIPKEIEIRDELPKTIYGKINFRLLQDEEDEKRKKK